MTPDRQLLADYVEPPSVPNDPQLVETRQVVAPVHTRSLIPPGQGFGLPAYRGARREGT